MRLPTGYLAGRQLITATSQAAPAAGADFTLTVPAGRFWLVRSVRAVLTCSAAVANRLPKLTVTVDGTVVATLPISAVAVASEVVRATWAAELPAYKVAGAANQSYAVAPIPALILPAGATLASLTDGIDVADAWGAPTVLAWDVWTESGSGDVADMSPEMMALQTLFLG